MGHDASTHARRPHRMAAVLLAGLLALGATACGDDDDAAAPGERCFDEPGAEPVDAEDAEPGTRVTLVTHESFDVSEGVFEAFTEETGIEVEVLAVGDAGTIVSESILSRDQPLGDVLFGVDNTLLCRALEAGLFLPFEAAGLDQVDDDLELDPHHRVTPIDYGDVCVNYWRDAVGDEPPTSLDDLADPDFADAFVTPSPETSSPGLAFLLATIARFGEDDWEDYWRSLRDNGVEVTSGWNDAYYGSFVAGGGDRSLVLSYATSPVAEVVFAEEPVDEPPTGVLTDGCFRQVEFAGVLAGTEHPAEAAALVEFLLSPTFQADVPLKMFVFPARGDVEVPAVFAEHAAVVEDPLTLDPQAIEASRDDWTERWSQAVLG